MSVFFNICAGQEVSELTSVILVKLLHSNEVEAAVAAMLSFGDEYVSTTFSQCDFSIALCFFISVFVII